MTARRAALWVGLFAFAVVSGCGDDDAPGAGDAGTDGAVRADGGDAGPDGGVARYGLFDVWREVRDVARQSPGHLPARADDVVATHDPAAIHAFVRDEIATYPPARDETYGLVSATRWGTRATLRAGAGTMREKAELLRELYERAGLTATVVGGMPAADVDMTTLFPQRPTPRLRMTLTPEQQARFDTVFGPAPAPVTPTLVDRAGVDSSALAATLEAVAGVGAPAFDFSRERIPLVRVMVAGAPQYANPNVPGAAFGDPRTTGDPTPVSAADDPMRVQIELEAARADAPFDRFSVVRGDFSADDVTGRRVRLAFAPVLDFASLPGVQADDVQLLVPVLKVEGPHVDAALRDRLSVVGQPLSRAGERVVVRDDGEILLDDVSLGTGTSPDPAAAAAVTRVEVSADPAQFPRVSLRVKALDASGHGVPGLGAASFRVEEEGAAHGFVVHANRAPPPKLVLLFDVSTSVPAEFRGAAAVALGLAIADPVLASRPDAEVRVAAIDVGGLRWAGAFTSDRAEIQRQLETMDGLGSDIWSSLADAASSGATVVVTVTDGDPSDTITPELESRISAGPPVVAVGVGPVMEPNIRRIAELTSGTAVIGADATAAATAANAFIAERALQDYELRYLAPIAGPMTRHVRVAVDSGRVEGATMYDVPPSPARAPRLSGLYLTVTIGSRSVTRTLAGYDSGFTTAPMVTDEAIRQTDDALFSSHVFMVEGAPPDPEIWVDELLTEKLALEPFVRAIGAGEPQAAERMVRAGILATPIDLMWLNARVAALPGEPLVYEAGLRVTTHSIAPDFAARRVRRSTDVFPLSDWSAAGTDPAAAWRATMRHTLHVMLVEASRATTSTRSTLGAAPLRRVRPSTVVADLADLDSAIADRWYRLLETWRTATPYAIAMPMTGTPEAWWAIDDRGATVGMLGSLRGDGFSDADFEADRNMIDFFFDAINRIGGEDTIVGVWAALERAKLIALSYATQVIAGGTAPTDADWARLARETGCGVGGAVFGGYIPDAISGVMDAIGDAESAAGAMRYMGAPVDTPDLSPLCL